MEAFWPDGYSQINLIDQLAQIIKNVPHFRICMINKMAEINSAILDTPLKHEK